MCPNARERIQTSANTFWPLVADDQHYFKIVLRVVVTFATNFIKPDPNYNQGVEHHHRDPNEYPMFQVEIVKRYCVFYSYMNDLEF